MTNYSNIYNALPVIFEDNIYKGSLYHYTSIEGFLLMLQSINQKKCYLFPGHMRYQNDKKEFDEGLKFVDDNFLKITSEMWKKCFPKEIEEINTNIFISCFSSNGDLLEQWKYYGSKCGLSIEFDFSECEGFWESQEIPLSQEVNEYNYNEHILTEENEGNDPFGFDKNIDNHYFSTSKKGLTRQGISLSPINVLYEEDDKHNVLKKTLITDINKKMLELNLYESYSELNQYVECTISAFIPMCKNYYFKHEKESRLLFFPSENTEIKYREKNGRILPYLKCVVVNKDSEKYPVLSVMVGPGNNQNLVFNAVINMLDGIDNHNFISEKDCEKVQNSLDLCYNCKSELREKAKPGRLYCYQKDNEETGVQDKVVTYYSSRTGILVSKSPIPFRD